MPELRIGKGSVVCSQHFEESCFRVIRSKWSCLRENAFPTVFPVMGQQLSTLPSSSEPRNIGIKRSINYSTTLDHVTGKDKLVFQISRWSPISQNFHNDFSLN